MKEITKLGASYVFCSKACYFMLQLLGGMYSLAYNYITLYSGYSSEFGGLCFGAATLIFPIIIGLLIFLGLLHISGVVHPTSSEKDTTEIGPISMFCYKWCPRLLIVMSLWATVGLISAITVLSFNVWHKPEFYCNTARMISDCLLYPINLLATINVVFMTFTILLKILRSTI